MAKTRCIGKTKTGQPCPNSAGPSGYCFTHDPARGAERAAARKRGGYNARPTHGSLDAASVPRRVRSLDDVLTLLDYALAETIPLMNGVQRGRLLVALAGAYVEALKVGEFEKRLAAIEAALKIARQPNDKP